MIEKIEHNGKLLSIIIRHSFNSDGIHFFTPHDFSQQLAYMKRPKGHKVDCHVHNPVIRQIVFTKEVLFLKRGKIRIDFYTDEKNYIESLIMEPGDVILLATGGHGIEMLEESELIEIKQGPYTDEMDKTRFVGVDQSQIRVRHYCQK